MAKKNRVLSMAIELRKFMHASPFSPFHIKTTDGDTFTVAHPDFIMISPMGDTAVLYPKEEQGHRALNLRQIVSMEPVRNGSRKSGKR
jgi:hypothetical protein